MKKHINILNKHFCHIILFVYRIIYFEYKIIYTFHIY